VTSGSSGVYMATYTCMLVVLCLTCNLEMWPPGWPYIFYPSGRLSLVSLCVIGQMCCMLMTFHGSVILKKGFLLQLAFEPPL